MHKKNLGVPRSDDVIVYTCEMLLNLPRKCNSPVFTINLAIHLYMICTEIIIKDANIKI